MLALPTLVALSVDRVDEPVNGSTQPADVQLEWFSVAAALEASCTLPRFQGLFELKDGVEPGRFAPLGPPTKEADAAELALGRASMIAAFAWLVVGGLGAGA